MVPSPSGSKLLVVRNAENNCPTYFEIWNSSQVEREFHIPSSIHGSVYSDGWFEGISWNSDETLIAYIAEEPISAKPTFTYFGYKKGNCPDKDCNSWKGEEDWEEGWGEAYAGKRLPKPFVININSGEICAVPVVMWAEDGNFPGLYCSNILCNPWLSDGRTMILSSAWGSTLVILTVDVLSGDVSRISPSTSEFSWDVLTLDGDNIIAGAKKPYEAIFASSKSKKHDACDPLIVVLHGGPHCVSLSSFSKSLSFLCSLGFSLLIVSYRGSLGFGEEAVQSLPGRAGSQDVNDVLAAVDYVIGKGLADPSKIVVVGLSHGGFLTIHLIGQAPDKFATAAARNPVCNLALMVGTTDIPDWCYFEAFGSEAKSNFTEAPSAEHLALFYDKSPISHVSKVKTPTLMLLGAKDLRVPITDGLQYARALKEKGIEVNVMMFPDGIHELDRPQTDFESFLNIGVWFKKYCS
ncbi:putative pentatricopeptide repeat-containing protein [Capsicum annuum]|nr:putative pentatricopeptide repeat-containing protein [Capsicum annuum]